MYRVWNWRIFLKGVEKFCFIKKNLGKENILSFCGVNFSSVFYLNPSHDDRTLDDQLFHALSLGD